jgi:hypothetical protein
MKKVLGVVFVFAVLICVTPNLNAKESPNFAISINPFATLIPLILGGIGVEGSLEFAISPSIGIFIPVEYLSLSSWGWTYSYVSFGAEGRYYFAYFDLEKTDFKFGDSRALSGLWGGAGVNLQFWTIGTWRDTVITIPIKAGYKFVFGEKSGFFLEPYLGFKIGFGFSNWTGASYNRPSYSGFIYGVGLGYAF